MSRTYSNSTIRLPSEDEVELAAQSSRRLAVAIGDGDAAHLRLIDGDFDVTVPVSAIHMLVDILTLMSQGKAVSLVPIDAELTTQAAADMLNVSRPHLVKLVESGAIPFHKVGRHRRLYYEDVVAYKERQAETSAKALAELTAEAQELGLGY
ncbi:MAG: helix-turn-helix domain-containing protein [Chromatiales bacterium]|nr:helix-turn-helix domain-containing protein [Gammaproteobacteria bacterium]MCP5352539.1 helix-turn-helix domain-containing protein [Chromatiales bacterium]